MDATAGVVRELGQAEGPHGGLDVHTDDDSAREWRGRQTPSSCAKPAAPSTWPPPGLLCLWVSGPGGWGRVSHGFGYRQSRS